MVLCVLRVFTEQRSAVEPEQAVNTYEGTADIHALVLGAQCLDVPSLFYSGTHCRARPCDNRNPGLQVRAWFLWIMSPGLSACQCAESVRPTAGRI